MLLGCIADDFTGASDLASLLARGGMRVVQTIGIPDVVVDDADAVVVALKSRTAPVDQAVGESLAALRRLRVLGCRQYFFKICSTFDSTAEGNIGPVMEALMAELGAPLTVVCPAFPGNARTVYRGHLFVGDRLLSESGMENHPLTPMRDSNLVRLLQPQTRLRVGLVTHDRVSRGPAELKHALDEAARAGLGAVVVDAVSEADLRTIAEAAHDLPLLTGASGLSIGIPENFRRAGLLHPAPTDPEFRMAEGRTAMIAGSCSAATLAQVERWLARAPGFRIDPAAVMAGDNIVGAALDWAGRQPGDFMIYSTAAPGDVRAIQARHPAAAVGEEIEQTLADIAAGLADAGLRRFVVAGGETSGAVVRKLGIRALRVGPSIAPGVPWMQSLHEPRISLALKSGNFGGPQFFEDALAAAP